MFFIDPFVFVVILVFLLGNYKLYKSVVSESCYFDLEDDDTDIVFYLSMVTSSVFYYVFSFLFHVL